MKIFKNDSFKKEFERFQKEDLLSVLECGYCQKTKCGWKHHKFQAGIVEKNFAKTAINLT